MPRRSGDTLAPSSRIQTRLADAQGRLNPRRRQLLAAIVDSASETFFLSTHQLARRYRVNPATIVRAVQVLGYERFADFAEDMREHFVVRLTPYTIMAASVRAPGTITEHMQRALDRDRDNLEALRGSPDMPAILDLARRIHRARRVVVVGVDLAATLASFLAYGLLPLGFDAEAPVGSSGLLYHKIRTLTKQDLVIGISFGRCLFETVDALKRARERGVPTFGITDAVSTPIARHADGCLMVSISSTAYTGSYVAPMALFNALFMACAHIKPKRSLARLLESEAQARSGPRWFDEAPASGRAVPAAAKRARARAVR
jgi:RpiR family carbohydrate utilization transcriptional regulator